MTETTGRDRPPLPRWVRWFAIGAGVVLAAGVLAFVLSGGEHGPGRHLPGRDHPTGHTPGDHAP